MRYVTIKTRDKYYFSRTNEEIKKVFLIIFEFLKVELNIFH